MATKKEEVKKPEPKTAKPDPKAVKSATKEVKPDPKAVKPATKEVKPDPKAAKPATKEVKPDPKAAKPATKEAKPDPKAVKPEPQTVKPAPKDEDMVYHISKRKEDRRWQVKAEGASKALKLFFTQDEAIAYAKTVAGNQEGRIVIHKEDGSFRKLKY